MRGCWRLPEGKRRSASVGAASVRVVRTLFTPERTRRLLVGRHPFVDDILAAVPGIAVGAGIHGYVPENFMASLMGRDAWWAVPLAMLLGVPLYSNAAGIILIGYLFNALL